MRIALADNRRCFIMLFSSEVVHYELTSERTGAGDPFPEPAFSRRHRSGQLFRAIERLQNPQWWMRMPW